MSRIVIVILLQHHHKLVDLSNDVSYKILLTFEVAGPNIHCNKSVPSYVSLLKKCK
jgi:hypothetical protein